jgi:hypothetical protein
MDSSRKALADATLMTSVTFEQVYLPVKMEQTFAPRLSRITDAEWELICDIRLKLVHLRETLTKAKTT